jgi:hypothetical protein
MNTVRVLAGGGGAAPAAWPASRTKRVELWDRLPGQRAGELGTRERALLRRLLAREGCAGELAFQLGLELQEVQLLLSGLQASGLVARRALSWQCTYAGRAALCALPQACAEREVERC